MEAGKKEVRELRTKFENSSLTKAKSFDPLLLRCSPEPALHLNYFHKNHKFPLSFGQKLTFGLFLLSDDYYLRENQTA